MVKRWRREWEIHGLDFGNCHCGAGMGTMRKQRPIAIQTMAKLVHIRCTRAEAEQLLAYLLARDQGDDAWWYYGNREHFERRHKSLKAALERSIAQASSMETHREVEP